MCWLMKTSRPTASATVFFRCAPTPSTTGGVAAGPVVSGSGA